MDIHVHFVRLFSHIGDLILHTYFLIPKENSGSATQPDTLVYNQYYTIANSIGIPLMPYNCMLYWSLLDIRYITKRPTLFCLLIIWMYLLYHKAKHNLEYRPLSTGNDTIPSLTDHWQNIKRIFLWQK